MIIQTPRLVIPRPALHLRQAGPLVAGFAVNWKNVGERHGKARFRIRAFNPDLGYVKRVLDPLYKHWIDDPEDAWEFWRKINSEKRPSWFPSLEDHPGTLYAVDSVNFIISTGASQTWTKPVDFTNVNHFEGIGSGSNGGDPDVTAGWGGAGGGYARINNFAAGATESFDIGAGNSSTDTTFHNSSTLSAAYGLNQATHGTNTGAAQTQIGGDGGNYGTNTSGGGGGGAGGPSGDGSNGEAGSFFTYGGAGGNGGGGSGGAGGARATSISQNGNPGANGTEWDASHGSGGGGGGDVANNTGFIGGAAGNYGAGAGGTGFTGNSAAGSQGLLVYTYTPASLAFFSLPIF